MGETASWFSVIRKLKAHLGGEYLKDQGALGSRTEMSADLSSTGLATSVGGS